MKRNIRFLNKRLKRLKTIGFISSERFDYISEHKNQLFKWNGVTCSCRRCRSYKKYDWGIPISQVRADAKFKHDMEMSDC